MKNLNYQLYEVSLKLLNTINNKVFEDGYLDLFDIEDEFEEFKKCLKLIQKNTCMKKYLPKFPKKEK